MSCFMGDRIRNNGQMHVCSCCLHRFCDKATLERYVPYCLCHPLQDLKKDKDEPIFKFRGYYKQYRLPFHLICDFKSFLSPIENDDNRGLARSMSTASAALLAIVLQIFQRIKHHWQSIVATFSWKHLTST